MNLFKSKITSILSGIVLTLTLGTFASAQELNLPGFSGTLNTTVTSGVSMRLTRDCESVRGTKYLDGDTGGAYATAVAGFDAAFKVDGEGCAPYRTDGYGNTGLATSGPQQLIGANADGGRTNFDGGDIFDATQRVFSEITGYTDSGMAVNLSFVGTYNPVVDINGNPEFAPFDSKQQKDIETDLRLLNAYVSQDINMDHSVTVGRFVTSWGESTFIPIGMNGLTTNAIDLTALRNPGSSIKEALIPTEQITFNGFLSDGWSYEAYLQMNEAHVKLDEEGQFYGSDVASGDRLIVSGQYSGNDQARAAGCSFLNSMPTAAGGANLGCTEAALAFMKTATGTMTNEMFLIQTGANTLGASSNAIQIALKSGIAGTGAAGTWGGNAGDIPAIGATGSGAGAVTLATAFAGFDEWTRKQGRKSGTVDIGGGTHVFADGEEQFGLSLRKFLPDVGTGVDLGFHITQYDSKVPYLRLKGQQGYVAGDFLGLFTLAGAHASGSEATLAAYLGASALPGSSAITLTSAETVAFTQILGALGNVAYGEGACGAYQKGAAANALYGRGTTATAYTNDEINLALQRYNYTAINGKLYHDSTKCAANAATWGTASTQSAAAALLGAALTPLNAAEYDFIYPENLLAMGISANTNVGSTALQLEVTYRPDFPLATDGSDQGQQLSDAAGTTNLLGQAVAKGYYDASLATLVQGYYDAGNGVSGTSFASVLDAITNFKRSNLPTISTATVAAGDYYTTPYFEYDVWSGTVGTTTAFTASHPITFGLGADSTVFLSEVGFVYVPDLLDSSPVARNGFRDGIGGAKCGGVTNGAGNPTNFGGAAAVNLVGATHLGSSQTDPLFGNGGYCESKNNADDFAMTYRLIGSASYNNIANTPWNLSNSVVWSHDFNGYAPSSMGGFVPGKQSLSLTSTFTKGPVKASLNYVNQMGDKEDNLGYDMDYVSASMSYAF
ncbi:DUF1302 domain-containing protein [Pelagibacterales bacterium]|nr:DUF1302 domain-containing protein [Pelagibacterales bacterium]